MEDMLKQWIAENGLKPLDAEEEKKLAFSVMTYKRLLKKLEWYNRNPLAVDEAVIAQGKNAMEDLVTHMIPLGIKYARKYSARYPESSQPLRISSRRHLWESCMQLSSILLTRGQNSALMRFTG